MGATRRRWTWAAAERRTFEMLYHVVFSGGVSATSQAPDAARQLMKFLTGPTAIPVIKVQGMEPVR